MLLVTIAEPPCVTKPFFSVTNGNHIIWWGYTKNYSIRVTPEQKSGYCTVVLYIKDPLYVYSHNIRVVQKIIRLRIYLNNYLDKIVHSSDDI